MLVFAKLLAVAALLWLPACLARVQSSATTPTLQQRTLRQWNPSAAAGLFNVTLPSSSDDAGAATDPGAMHMDVSAVAMVECPPGLGFDPVEDGNYTAARMQAEFRKLLKKAWLPYHGNLTLTIENWAVKFRLNVTQPARSAYNTTWHSDPELDPPTVPLEMCGQSSLIKLAGIRSACNNVSTPLNISVTCSMDAVQQPADDHWRSCTTTPGRMYVTVWFPDDCSLAAMADVLPQVVDAFTANHTDSMCARQSYQDMNIAMQARARYSFAVAPTVDPGTAGMLCTAVGTQTAQALSNMIEGSMAWPSVAQSALMSSPDCVMNTASPAPTAGNPPSSSNNLGVIVGVVVGVVCGAALLSGMVVGYQAYKRQKTNDPAKYVADPADAAGASLGMPPGAGPPGGGGPAFGGTGGGSLPMHAGIVPAATDIQNRDKEAESLNKSYRALQMAAILSGAGSTADPPQKYSAAAARKARLKAQRAAEQAAAQAQGLPGGGGAKSSFFSSSMGSSFFSWASSSNTTLNTGSGGPSMANSGSSSVVPLQLAVMQQGQGQATQQQLQLLAMQQGQGQGQAAQHQLQLAAAQQAQGQATQLQLLAAQHVQGRGPAVQQQQGLQQVHTPMMTMQQAQMLVAQQAQAQMQVSAPERQAPGTIAQPQGVVSAPPLQPRASALTSGLRPAPGATTLQAAETVPMPMASRPPVTPTAGAAAVAKAEALGTAAQAPTAAQSASSPAPVAASGSKASAAAAAAVYRHAQTVTTAGPVIPQQPSGSESATATPAASSPPSAAPSMAVAGTTVAPIPAAVGSVPALNLGSTSPAAVPLSARGSNGAAVLDLGLVQPATNVNGLQGKSISNVSGSWGSVAQGSAWHATAAEGQHQMPLDQIHGLAGGQAGYGQAGSGRMVEAGAWQGQRTSYTSGLLMSSGHQPQVRQLHTSSVFTALSVPSQGRSSGSQELSPMAGSHGTNGSRQSVALSDAQAAVSSGSAPGGAWPRHDQATAGQMPNRHMLEAGGPFMQLAGFGSFGHVPATTGGGDSPVSPDSSHGQAPSGGSNGNAPTQGSHGPRASNGSHGTTHAVSAGASGASQHQVLQPHNNLLMSSHGNTPLGPCASTPDSPFSPPPMDLLEFLSEEPTPAFDSKPHTTLGMEPNKNVAVPPQGLPFAPKYQQQQQIPLQQQQILLQQQLYVTPGTPDVADILDMLEGPDPLPFQDPLMQGGVTNMAYATAGQQAKERGSMAQLLRAPDPVEVQEIMSMLDGIEPLPAVDGSAGGYPGALPMFGMQGSGGNLGRQQQMTGYREAASRAVGVDEERKLFQDWVAEDERPMQPYAAAGSGQQWQQVPPAAMAELLKRQQMLLHHQQMQLQQQQQQLQQQLQQQHW